MYANDRAFYHLTRNRESGTQQQVLSAPSPNALHRQEAVAKQGVPRVMQRKFWDPSSVAQEKKTRKQGIDSMSSQKSPVSQLR